MDKRDKWLVEYYDGDNVQLVSITTDPDAAMLAIDTARARGGWLAHREWMRMLSGNTVQSYHLLLPRQTRLLQPSAFTISRWDDDTQETLDAYLQHYVCDSMMQEAMEDALAGLASE